MHCESRQTLVYYEINSNISVKKKAWQKVAYQTFFNSTHTKLILNIFLD